MARRDPCSGTIRDVIDDATQQRPVSAAESGVPHSRTVCTRSRLAENWRAWMKKLTVSLCKVRRVQAQGVGTQIVKTLKPMRKSYDRRLVSEALAVLGFAVCQSHVSRARGDTVHTARMTETFA